MPPPLLSLQNTDQVEYVLQLGALSVIPYVAEMVLEHGVVRAALNLLHQVCRCFELANARMNYLNWG